jgi:hypothetical protein
LLQAVPSSWNCLSRLCRKRASCMPSLHNSSMYGYTVHVKRIVVKGKPGSLGHLHRVDRGINALAGAIGQPLRPRSEEDLQS